MKRVRNTLVGILACLAVAVLAAITGCKSENTQFTFNAAAVAASLVQLNRGYDEVSAIIAAHLEAFTPQEQDRLDAIDRDLHTIREQIRVRAENPDEVLQSMITASELNTVYTAAKNAYLEARALVAPRLNSLNFAERAQIDQFDAQARALDRAMLPLVQRATGSDITPVIQELLIIARMVAEIAVSFAQ